MTKYLNGRFSVAAPSNDNYAQNYTDIFGLRKRDGDCVRCDGHGRVEGVECVTCEGTGRAAYASKFDTTDAS
jgi:DnaJ-class molecular chaperone